MIGTVSFRSATFGGFNREDVMRYIAKTARENQQALEEAQSEIEEQSEKAQELSYLNEELKQQLAAQKDSSREEIDSLHAQIRDLLQQRTELMQKCQQLDSLSKQLTETESRSQALKNMSDQQRDEIVRVKALNAQQSIQLAEKDSRIAVYERRIAEMEEDSRSYREMCNSIGKIEMEMRYRATVMERESQERAEKTIAEAKLSYDTIMANATLDAQHVREQVSDQLEQMKKDLTLTSQGVNDAIEGAMSRVQRVQGLLEELGGSLDAQVSAVNLLQMADDTFQTEADQSNTDDAEQTAEE